MNANPELPHLSRRLLFGYFQNSVPEQQALQIEEHLADCHDCTSLARQVRGFVDFWKQCSPPVPELSPPLAPLAHSTLLTAISEGVRAAWHRLNFGLPRTTFDLQNETQVEGPLVLGVAIVAVVIALPLLLSTINDRRQPPPRAAAVLTFENAHSPSANPTRLTEPARVIDTLPPESKVLGSLFADSPTTEAKPTESAEAAPETPPQPRMHQLRDDLDELSSRLREVRQKVAVALRDEAIMDERWNLLQRQQASLEQSLCSSVVSVPLAESESPRPQSRRWPRNTGLGDPVVKGAELLLSE
jgi:hypothetical protein